MSSNPALTIDMVLAYPDLPWDWSGVSKNMNINNILDHPELKWDWKYVSLNPSVTM